MSHALQIHLVSNGVQLSDEMLEAQQSLGGTEQRFTTWLQNWIADMVLLQRNTNEAKLASVGTASLEPQQRRHYTHTIHETEARLELITKCNEHSSTSSMPQKCHW
eukprot:gnl/MRDRNA2_/MRDRNA2_275412_c0_seq1.p1 gnl/MRDRNA2_/MRDRNA2_275412_c0~~gnl/MRDRNA2_/MRDRNA2_275412_c0_seq1.p1  ORF type:complete len:106 (-),score=16.70 gnl/MRDRNA2_/MRDRNA2_275412_c0_seq1:174-491(-)